MGARGAREGTHVVEDVVVVDVVGLAAEDHARAFADGALRPIAGGSLGIAGPLGATPLRRALSTVRIGDGD